MENHWVDINQDNAKAYLIDESFKRPVLIDFWADWCGPCKSLMPILEKLAAEYDGDFLLAKVNADEQQMIAGQFGVRSLPTVMVMKEGQPVDGFAGAQSEEVVRQLLDKYLPKPWDKQLLEAKQSLAAGDVNAALVLLRQAYTASNQQADIACVLAETLLLLRRLDEAQGILDQVRLVDRDATYEQVAAQLELAKNADKAPEVAELEQQHQANPEDRQIAYQLALQYSQHQYHKEALELLFGLLRKDLNCLDGEARKAMTDILAVLGKGDPLAIEYQRKLYSLLY